MSTANAYHISSIVVNVAYLRKLKLESSLISRTYIKHLINCVEKHRPTKKDSEISGKQNQNKKQLTSKEKKTLKATSKDNALKQ